MNLDVEKYKNSHIHKFSHEGKRYIFDYKNLILAELDDLFDKCFDFVEGKLEYDDLFNEFGEEANEALKSIDEFVDSDIFYSKQSKTYPLLKEYELGLISLPPVHNCNLRCTYCFADHGEVFQETEKGFNAEMLEKALRYIYYEYMPNCKKYRIDFVSGGEPLLNFDIIRQVKEISDILYKETNKPLEMWLCTNGTSFTPEILEFLDKNHINIGISIDGDKNLNDSMRIDANGNGTYERVVKSIKDIKESKRYSRSLKDIWGLVVITNQTKSIKDILVHHREIGIRNVQMKIVRLPKDSAYSINKENIDRVKEMYDELFEFFTAQMKKNSVDYVKMILNDNDFAGKVIRRLLLRYVVVNRCQAGKNKVSIAANGDLYPCDSFVGMPQFKLGNVDTGINEQQQQKFKNMSVNSNSFCVDCWSRYVCGGDCYHNSYLANGLIQKPDEVICELEKHVIYKALIFLDEMATNYSNLYEHLVNFLNKRELIK